MRSASPRLFKKGDLLFWSGLIALAILIGSNLLPRAGQSSMALVQINNHIKYELNLNQNDTIALDEFRPPVVVQVRNKSVSIIENDCPQKICIRMGAISKPGQTIVCVPKKLLIFIPYAKKNDQTIKAITG